MRKKWIIIIVSVSILLICLAFIGPIMSNVENPKYKITSSSKNIEIRKYEKTIVAETKVEEKESEESRSKSIKHGFKTLANYIFGKNSLNEKIKMTSPVTQEKVDNYWKIRFFMPSKYSFADLPKPNTDNIKIKEINEKTYAVIKFSGSINNKNLENNTKILEEFLIDKKIKNTKSKIYAFYNPPWTLPFFLRNEVMIEILEHEKSE